MGDFEIVLFLTVLTGASAACPNGWIRHDSNCYHFSHDAEDWPGAETICSILGGSLLEVDDEKEATFITGEVKVLQKDFWLSLSDLAEEGIWRWMGSLTPLSPTLAYNWSPGNPDNWRGNENCAFAHGTDGRWIDTTCSSQRNYICEKTDEEGTIIG